VLLLLLGSALFCSQDRLANLGNAKYRRSRNGQWHILSATDVAEKPPLRRLFLRAVIRLSNHSMTHGSSSSLVAEDHSAAPPEARNKHPHDSRSKPSENRVQCLVKEKKSSLTLPGWCTTTATPDSPRSTTAPSGIRALDAGGAGKCGIRRGDRDGAVQEPVLPCRLTAHREAELDEEADAMAAGGRSVIACDTGSR